MADLTFLPPNLVRGFAGGVAVIAMFAGACILWGIGGGLFAIGLFFAIDVSTDEVVERITGKTRFIQMPDQREAA